MLFSRVYNWIKYKTLPPSVLFLNRLYVERDSKHRRVTSNLGLTFRNSKWSSYARVNINIGSQNSYVTFLSKFITFLILVGGILKFTVYYNISSLQNPFYTSLWFLLDADLYLKTFLISSLLCNFQLLLNFILPKWLSYTTNQPNYKSEMSQLHLPKRLHKPLLYLWSTRGSQIRVFSENHFDSPSSALVSPTQTLLYSLYRLTFVLQRAKQQSCDLSDSLSAITRDTESTWVLQPNLSLPKYLSITLDYSLINLAAYASPKVERELSTWSLHNLNNELANHRVDLRSYQGLFYTPTISNITLNNLILNYPELTSLKDSAQVQASVIRWQRWLYKYNILHRASAKNVSNLTLTKKLISSGFYASDNSSRNIWVSSNSSLRSEDKAPISALYHSFYGCHNLSKQILGVNSFGLASLNFYEESYNWFLKRFYLFNALPTNSTTFTPNLQSALNTSRVDAINQWNAASLALHSSTTHSLTTQWPLSTLTPSIQLTSEKRISSYSSNLHLSYYDSNLFNTACVASLLNLTQNTGSTVSRFYVANNINPPLYPKH